MNLRRARIPRNFWDETLDQLQEQQRRIGEQLDHVLEEQRALVPVDDPVVERDGEVAELADDDLSAPHRGGRLDLQGHGLLHHRLQEVVVVGSGRLVEVGVGIEVGLQGRVEV